MNTGILLGILGILFINQCLCLKKHQESNSLSGAYFHNVGTYNFVDTRDETFLTSYTLTGLENALSNAKTKNELTYHKEIRDLEENLNNIYKVCNKNRRNYLPYGTTSIPENQLKNELEKALDDSTSILSDLISLASKNYTEKFDVKAKMNKTDRYNYNYLYPKYVSDFEVAKKYINFTFGLEKISRNSAVINVKMAIPVLVKAELKRVIYVPKKLHQSHEFEFLKDQSVNNLAVLMSFDGYRSYSSGQGYFLIKNMDTCQLVNETFLCDPSIMMKVQSSDDTCITKLYQSDCRWSDNYDCNRIRDKCGYEKSSRHNEFTHLSDNKFFALFTREANYHYKCEDGREEQGRLQFYSWGSNKFTGTVEVEENCSLITAFSSIINKDGIFEIKQVDDEEMIWADIPKIIGIPVWIFAISVAVICLIVLMLLITWICICVRRCKAKKASQYANLTNSG